MKIIFRAGRIAVLIIIVTSMAAIASEEKSVTAADIFVYNVSYTGVVEDDSVRWSGRAKFRVSATRDVSIPLPSQRAVLISIKLGRRDVPVIVSDDKWTIPKVRRGVHTIKWTALASWMDKGEERWLRMALPPSPIADVTIDFPDKGIHAAIEPALGVRTKSVRGRTRIEAELPYTTGVLIKWNRPAPELERSKPARETLRTRVESSTRIAYNNGVLEAEDFVHWVALTGATDSITFRLPAGWEVTSIRSESVKRWSVRKRDKKGVCELKLSSGTHRDVEFRVHRELILPELPANSIMGAPTIDGVVSHRGTVAFERSDQITAQVQEVKRLIRTDASSLGAPGMRPPLLAFRFVKTGAEATVTLNEPRAMEPELRASIISLLTIEREMLWVWAKVSFIVTRSRVDSFRMMLPPGVRLTGVRSKYLREYKTTSTPDGVIVEVRLDRGVKGKHGIAVDYERVLVSDGGIEFPFLLPMGVKSMEGEIGVEARENLEIEGEKAKNVQHIDITRVSPDIPQRATRPLLAAYRYSRIAQLDTPLKLTLTVKRHKPVDVKEAVADQALFETLALNGGGHITQAIFGIRNKGRQFMRLTLPRDAKVWSAFIAGEPVNPSRDDKGVVLVPLAKSAEENGKLMSFPIKIVYQSSGRPLRGIGIRRFDLPKVDLTVSRLAWKVILPDGPRFMKIGGTISSQSESGKRQRNYNKIKQVPLLIPSNFLKFQSKSRQSESKVNLAGIATAQVSFFSETGRYGVTFDEIGWSPVGHTKYAYFMGNDALLGGTGPQNPIPPFPLEVPSENFFALAVGNIDSDPFPDIWTIDENKTPRNIADDVNNYYSPEYKRLKKRGLFNNLDGVIQVASVKTAQSSGVLPIDIDIPAGGSPRLFLKLFPTEDNLPTTVSFFLMPKGLHRVLSGIGIVSILILGGVFLQRRKRNRSAGPGDATESPAKKMPRFLTIFMAICTALFLVQVLFTVLILFFA